MEKFIRFEPLTATIHRAVGVNGARDIEDEHADIPIIVPVDKIVNVTRVFTDYFEVDDSTPQGVIDREVVEDIIWSTPYHVIFTLTNGDWIRADVSWEAVDAFFDRGDTYCFSPNPDSYAADVYAKVRTIWND